MKGFCSFIRISVEQERFCKTNYFAKISQKSRAVVLHFFRTFFLYFFGDFFGRIFFCTVSCVLFFRPLRAFVLMGGAFLLTCCGSRVCMPDMLWIARIHA